MNGEEMRGCCEHEYESGCACCMGDCERCGDPEMFGDCDTCGGKYELSDRGTRCGDCGDCGKCCEHTAEGYEMSDVEADADTLASIGWGTDEDYGG